VSEERLSALAMLSVRKNLLESGNFNKKVTETFVLCKERSMNFRYGFSLAVNVLYIYLFLLLCVVKLFQMFPHAHNTTTAQTHELLLIL
jgi:hypothetical protein